MRTAAALLRACPLPKLEARILLAHALGWRRTELITRDAEPLSEAACARFIALQTRRAAGEPIAQIVGTREFFGLEFEVSPHVLIPRPETELLVETALAAVRNIAAPRVLDLGTGTGAIAISIAATRPDARIWALERSTSALALAQRNAAKLLGATRRALHWLESDWYATLDATLMFDVIVSNPPYIAKDDPHLTQGDLRFEPRAALTDEADGLGAIRAIIAGAAARLAPDSGQLWLEHGHDQAQAVRALLRAHGFCNIHSYPDLAAIERVSGGLRPALAK